MQNVWRPMIPLSYWQSPSSLHQAKGLLRTGILKHMPIRGLCLPAQGCTGVRYGCGYMASNADSMHSGPHTRTERGLIITQTAYLQKI